MTAPKICSIDGCDKPSLARTYCGSHYYHWHRYGNASREPSRKPAFAQKHFLESIKNPHPTDCMIWPYAVHQGVGRIQYQSKVQTVHRLALVMTQGEAPHDGMYACHNCHNGHLACFNPNHMYWGTPSQNSIDTVQSGNHASVKLNPDAVRLIRKSSHSDVPLLAKMFGVRESTINGVRYRKSWRHVPD